MKKVSVAVSGSKKEEDNFEYNLPFKTKEDYDEKLFKMLKTITAYYDISDDEIKEEMEKSFTEGGAFEVKDVVGRIVTITVNE